MFRPDFKEGVELIKDGSVTIPLPEDDAPAVALMMTISHGRNKDIPQNISAELLYKLTLFADKYELNDTVSLFVGLWTGRLCCWGYDLDLSTKDTIYRWLTISYIFSDAQTFDRATRAAVRNGLFQPMSNAYYSGYNFLPELQDQSISLL